MLMTVQKKGTTTPERLVELVCQGLDEVTQLQVPPSCVVVPHPP